MINKFRKIKISNKIKITNKFCFNIFDIDGHENIEVSDEFLKEIKDRGKYIIH